MKEEKATKTAAEDKERKLQAIREHGAYVSAPVGSSMRPMLRAGRDTVVIVAPSGRLRKYDVALFCYCGRHIIHRVIRVCEDGYLFRGDNCIATETASDADVIGVMREFYRGERRISADAFLYRVYSRYAVIFSPLRHFPRRVIGKLKRTFGALKQKHK